MTIPSLSAAARGRAAPRPRLAALVVATLAAALLPVLVTATPVGATPDESTTPWAKINGNLAAARSSRPVDIQANRFAAFTLDRALIESELDRAPKERAAARPGCSHWWCRCPPPRATSSASSWWTRR